MKKTISAIILSLIFVGCGKENSQESSNQLNQLREDKVSPVISEIQVSTYTNEATGKVESMDIKKVIFNKKITQWELDPTISQLSLEVEQKHLPYFIVTVDDEDTPHERVSLSYCFYRGDQKISDTLLFKPAIPYGPKRWKVMISKETVGNQLLAFLGERKFVLQLKASDGINKSTTEEIRLKVSNLHPLIRWVLNPSDFPENKSSMLLGDVFKSSLQDEYWTLLKEIKERKSKSLDNNVVFSRIFIENGSFESLYIKIAFNGFLENELLQNYQTWDPESKSLESKPVSMERWSKAMVRLDVTRWDKDKLVKVNPLPLEGHENVYELPSAQESRGLVISLLTRLEFTEFSVQHYYSNFTPNFFRHLFKLHGVFSISSAAKGLPQEFYGLDSNWNNLTPELENIALISNTQ